MGDRKSRVKTLSWFLFGSVVVLTCLILWINYQNRLERLEHETLERLSSAVEATTDVYGRLVEMMFDESVHRPEIRELFSRAQQARDPLELAFWRGTIRNRLEPVFDRFAYYQVRLLNLILPDGTVFLRMHTPDLYGDNVLSYSRLQEIALKTRSPVRGFQVGRTQCVYRYSFPVFFGSQFLGSAEYGLTSLAFAEQLQKQFPGHYSLLLRREAAAPMNGKARSLLFTESGYSKGFYEQDSASAAQKLQEAVDPSLISLLKKRAAGILASAPSRLSGGEAFALFLSQSGKFYTLSFLPVKDAGGTFMGYITAIHENPAAKEIRELYVLFASLLLLFFLASALLLHSFLKSHFQLVEKALFDSLTGALKKSEFASIAEIEVSRARRYRIPLSVIMFDLDGFKSVNDEYGHLKGDEVLKALGQSILNSIRKADCFFRWGGDEFLLVLPNTGKEGARKLAEKLRKLASQLEVEPIQGITLSLGIAQLEEGDPDLGIVLKRADEALYRAKKQGKNRVSE